MKNYHLRVLIMMALLPLNIFAQGIREYKVDVFNSIELEEPISLNLVQGEQKIVVEGVPDDLQRIEFDVKNGVLFVKSNGISNLDEFKITVQVDNLKRIDMNGIAKLYTKGLIKGDTIIINMNGATKAELELVASKVITYVNGASKLELKGFAEQMDAETTGAAKLVAEDFKVNRVKIYLGGASRANVNAIKELYANVTGISKLSYEKEPSLKKEITKSTFSFNGNNEFQNEKVVISSSEKGDSTVVRIPGVKIRVNEKDDETKINIGDNEYIFNDKGMKIRKAKKIDKFRPHWAGFEIGFNGYFNNEASLSIPKEYNFLELNYVKSLNVNINFIELGANIYKNRFGVVSGLGLQWNNWRFDNDVVLSPDSAQIYGYHDKTIDSYIKSKLTASWLRIPILFEYQTSKTNHKNQFFVSAGTVLGLRLGAHSKQVHFADGDRNKPKIYDDFHLNPFKIDAELRIGWGIINLFANYSITKMFKDGEGPVLHPYTIGLTLANF